MAARRSFLFCSLLLLLALFVAPAQADEALPGKPEGTVASCFDGDTFKLSDRRVVRLAGIDTPELNKRDHKPQYYAREAAAILGAMVCGLADYLWTYPRIMFLFWFVFGLTLAAIKVCKTELERV